MVSTKAMKPNYPSFETGMRRLLTGDVGNIDQVCSKLSWNCGLIIARVGHSHKFSSTDSPSHSNALPQTSLKNSVC